MSLHRPEEASAIEAFDKGRAEEVAAIYFAACHGKEMRAVRSKFLKAFSTKAARAVKRGDDEKAWKIYDCLAGYGRVASAEMVRQSFQEAGINLKKLRTHMPGRRQGMLNMDKEVTFVGLLA